MGVIDRNKHIYLGDAVYAEKTDYHIILRTNSHRDEECTNIIYLEPEVLLALVTWLGNIVEKKEAKKNEC